MAFNWYQSANLGTLRTVMGYSGVALFGFATCKSIRLLISSRKPVVFVLRNGIRDTRISDELIERRSVEKISIWQYRRQKAVVLKVTPLVAKGLVGSSLRGENVRDWRQTGSERSAVKPTRLTIPGHTPLTWASQMSLAQLAELSIYPGMEYPDRCQLSVGSR
jgi:hypothetical protein